MVTMTDLEAGLKSENLADFDQVLDNVEKQQMPAAFRMMAKMLRQLWWRVMVEHTTKA